MSLMEHCNRGSRFVGLASAASLFATVVVTQSIVTASPGHAAESLVQVAAIIVTPDKAPGSDGWVLFPAGTKAWVDAACRQQLSDAGTPTQVLEWPAIAETPDTANLPCSSLAVGATVPLPAYRPTAVAVLTTADKPAGNDGWALLPNGSKTWIDAGCRTALAGLGTPVQVRDWPAIASVPDGPAMSCVDVTPLTGAGQPMLIFSPDKLPDGSDGWVLFPDGTYQWVSAQCRYSLLAQGAATVIAPWSQISTLPSRSPAVSCDGIIPKPTPVQTLATATITPAGGTVTAANGVSLAIPAGAVGASTTASVTAMTDGSYDLHIDGQWSGPVTVTLPVTGSDQVVHQVGSTWLPESAPGQASATVTSLSLFSTLKNKIALAACLRGGSAGVIRCLLQKGVKYIDNSIVKWLAKQISDTCYGQIAAGAVTGGLTGTAIAAFTGACVGTAGDTWTPPPAASTPPPPTPAPPTAPVTAPTSPPPPPAPSVSVRLSKGAPMRNASCSSSSCAYLAVSTTGIGAAATVTCYASGSPYVSYATSNGAFSQCYYGFPGRTVFVVVNGVRSNNLVW